MRRRVARFLQRLIVNRVVAADGRFIAARLKVFARARDFDMCSTGANLAHQPFHLVAAAVVPLEIGRKILQHLARRGFLHSLHQVVHIGADLLFARQRWTRQSPRDKSDGEQCEGNEYSIAFG